MPFRKIPLVTDETYHILNRGVAKAPIYSHKKDFQRFISLIKYYQYANTPTKFSRFKTLSKKNRLRIIKQLQKDGEKLVKILAYCLMPNHFHLLLTQNKNQGNQ